MYRVFGFRVSFVLCCEGLGFIHVNLIGIICSVVWRLSLGLGARLRLAGSMVTVCLGIWLLSWI